MDPNLIAQLILAAIQVATQLIPTLSSGDAAAVSAALTTLNAQVDQLHQNAGAAVS
jgi:outer membrane murein-binding lipoprotein Lpp